MTSDLQLEDENLHQFLAWKQMDSRFLCLPVLFMFILLGFFFERNMLL